MPPRATRRTDAWAYSAQVRQTIVETLETLRVTGISTKDVVSFKQKRLIYERLVTEKNSDQSITIPATSY